MESLKLIRPNENFEKQVLEMFHEFNDDNTTPY
jgi:predicted acetyltransferase